LLHHLEELATHLSFLSIYSPPLYPFRTSWTTLAH
jgi:hypothetical protein